MQDQETIFRQTSAVNVAGNTAKILVEGSIGIQFGSTALIADAVHSIADLLASMVVLVWGRLSYREADTDHPHGHERIEPITALFVGLVILLLGLRLVYDTGGQLLQGTGTARYSPFLLGGIGFALLDMALVYQYTRRKAHELDSPGLHALAQDCLNDIYTSLAVIIGILGLALGIPLLDPLAGMLVALLVIHQGIAIGHENLQYLTGSAPPEAQQAAIEDTVRSHPRVMGLHDIVIHHLGPAIEVEMHVEVDGDMSLRDAHDLETVLVRQLREMDGVKDAHLHLDPSGIGEWRDAADPDGQE